MCHHINDATKNQLLIYRVNLRHTLSLVFVPHINTRIKMEFVNMDTMNSAYKDKFVSAFYIFITD